MPAWLLLILKFAVAVAFLEAVVEILVTSFLLEPIRAWLNRPRKKPQVEAVAQALLDHAEAATEKTEFDPEQPRKLGVLSRCGYCLSVSFGVGTAILLRIESGLLAGWGLPAWVEWVVWGFLVHRFSNIWHEALSRWFHRVPWMVTIHKTKPPKPPPSETPKPSA